MTKNETPLISIVTCTLNQHRFLPQLLDSVQTQLRLNFEHVIIDGNSTDGTRNLIEQYVKKNEQRYPIQYHTFPAKGISDAMNNGVLHSSGDWIIVVHGDDYLEDVDATQRMEVEIARHQNSSWLVGNSVRNFFGITFNTRTFFIRPLLYRLLLLGVNLLPHQNTLMRRTLFFRYGPFLTHLKTHMDYEFYLRLLSDRVYPTAVNQSFTVFRRHANSQSINPWYFVTALAAIAGLIKLARKKIRWPT
jgi:glycosyltransferase involved in cell wall biosynthesis